MTDHETNIKNAADILSGLFIDLHHFSEDDGKKMIEKQHALLDEIRSKTEEKKSLEIIQHHTQEQLTNVLEEMVRKATIKQVLHIA